MSRKDSIVYIKAFDFSVKVVKLYKFLEERREYVIGKQLLKSGTSVGANIREGLEGQSKKDFISKLSIALKEAVETEYWLELLVAAELVEYNKVDSLLSDAREIIRILVAIIKTSKGDN
ncbi:four helix bundle protein [Halonatronum saccharophilum]|uniref:four helix bundle protein n=1 Tax=Halonatronum saccharophilum TaxID=150060 RepID=UPI00048294E0|nr:four helix bundle protein [Halonatronum saccharophilum]